MAPDLLRIRNMRFFAYHGLLPKEGELGQEFEVDVDIHGDLSRAGQDDDPSLMVDYTRVLGLVEEVVTKRRFGLIEAVAEAVAAAVGKAVAPVKLTVRVRKPSPPVDAIFDGVEVEITRSFD